MINLLKKVSVYRAIYFFLILTFIQQSHCYNFFRTLTEINRINREALFQTFKTIFLPNLNNDTPEFTVVREIPSAPTETFPQSTKPNFTFKDLAGKIPEDIKEIVGFIKNPENFRKVGAEMPKGILLVGPPGTGKTSIARAIAGEADAEFFCASGSEFVELFVGMGPKRIRELFEKAHKVVEDPNKRAIIFIDELDAIAGARSSSVNSPGDIEFRSTINELLNQMDGFKQYDSILVIGATNTPHSIDSALKRPGRFDRIVEIGLPDQESRIQILNLYCSKIKCASDIDIAKLAEATKGFSGAELKNLTNEAAIRSGRQKMSEVTMEHFELALKDLKSSKKYSR